MGGLQRRFCAITTGRVLGSRCWGQTFRDNVFTRLIAVHGATFPTFLASAASGHVKQCS